MPPSNTDQYNEEPYGQDIELESVGSLDEADSTKHELPVNAAGDVPKGLVFLLHRARKGKDGQQASGLAFSCEKDGERQQILFAQSQGWIAKASREEIVFKQGNSQGSVVGSVNFHHWLVDQSKAVVVEDSQGNEWNLKRTGLGSSHSFERDGKKLFWRRAHGAGEGRSKTKRHLECVDENETVYAFYDRGKCFSAGPDREVGRLEVRVEGLSLEFASILLMTLAAMYVKLQKRIVQGSQAGWGGGLGAAVLYIVGG
ncbi:uncharacterized protein LTR77_009401 [Saxophila tyrrhenica]|uniref:Uncharacterized protein n=1 Tax=Saxophila tyrrhenica TaxID=1690608 RepID=A0AAV9NYG3_9PEZI|nr:hypothetical protein LTR77_009401 [Saxophila tyrrhenica]